MEGTRDYQSYSAVYIVIRNQRSDDSTYARETTTTTAVDPPMAARYRNWIMSVLDPSECAVT